MTYIRCGLRYVHERCFNCFPVGGYKTVNEEDNTRLSQEELDKLWEWYLSVFRPRRDNSGDPASGDTSPDTPIERDVGERGAI